MTSFEGVSHQHPLSANNRGAHESAINNNSIKHKNLFGANGFTFFDFLDIINPLQHIPVISSIYRSITGDQIDPGSKIAGATIFGGPLGTVLSSLDLAIENKTGHDIASHAATLFTGSINNNPAENLSSRIKTFNPTFGASMPLIDPKSNQEKLNSRNFVTEMESNPNTPKTAKKDFLSAGMTAIPIPKKAYFSPPPRNIIFNDKSGKIKSGLPTRVFREFNALSSNNNRNTLPQKLAPHYFTKVIPEPKTHLNQINPMGIQQTKWKKQNKTTFQENWFVNNMVLGLGKYEKTTRLTLNPIAKKYSVSR